MKNKKILSILTGSMLLMMHNSQSFFAEANDMSDSEDTGIIAKSLAENQSSKNTSILNNIKLTIEKEHLTLKVNLPQNYTLNVIESQDELTHFDERDSEFILKFNYESLKNSNVNIKLFENKQTIFEVDLEKLMDYLYENEIITNNSKENDGKLDLTLLDLVNSILPTDTIELEDTSSEDSDSEDTSSEDLSSDKISIEDKEISNFETKELKPKVSLFSLSTRRVADNGVYTVKSGDTFSNIAS